MRAVKLTLGAVVAFGAAALAGQASAGDTQKTEPTITATVTQPGSEQPGSDGEEEGAASEPDPVVCTDRPVPASPSLADAFDPSRPAGTGGTIHLELPYYSQDGTLHRYNIGRGTFERWMRTVCTDIDHPDHGRLSWQTVAPPDPALLLPIATRTATEQVEFPVPDISPAGDVPINLGMWLAVAPAGPYTARAELTDAVWAETTATLVSTTFDLGGDIAPITCEGFGTPIPDPDLPTRDAGPCGHVFTRLADRGPHSMTISSTWQVTWRLSSGATGQLDDIVATADHAFAVYEIQTVGVSG